MKVLINVFFFLLGAYYGEDIIKEFNHVICEAVKVVDQATENSAKNASENIITTTEVK